jgi:hypothetical protein
MHNLTSGRVHLGVPPKILYAQLIPNYARRISRPSLPHRLDWRKYVLQMYKLCNSRTVPSILLVPDVSWFQICYSLKHPFFK